MSKRQTATQAAREAVFLGHLRRVHNERTELSIELTRVRAQRASDNLQRPIQGSLPLKLKQPGSDEELQRELDNERTGRVADLNSVRSLLREIVRESGAMGLVSVGRLESLIASIGSMLPETKMVVTSDNSSSSLRSTD